MKSNLNKDPNKKLFGNLNFDFNLCNCPINYGRVNNAKSNLHLPPAKGII